MAGYLTGLTAIARREDVQSAMGIARRQTCFAGVLALVVAIAVSSDAFSQQSLQELESIRQFEQALRAVDAIKHRKKIQCILSIANGSLCECLSWKLPVSTYVRSYAAIANQEKERPEYEQLSAADRTIVDQCVSDSR